MSDTSPHASFVRKEMLPEQAPPATAAGPLRWMRENLFSSIPNAIMTIISVYVIYWVLSHVMGWLFLGVWNASSLNDCRTVLAAFGRESGACWAVIEDRWLQLMFGFYPSDQYWRPILALILMFVALAPVLFSDKVPAKLIWFSMVYPFIAVWLIWGGSIWSPVLMVAGFPIGYLAFKIVSKFAFSGLAIAAAIVAAALWWVMGWGAVDTALNRMIGEPRFETVMAQSTAQIEALPPQIAASEAARDAVGQDILAVSAERDAVAGQIAVIWAQLNIEEWTPELAEASAELDAIADPESEEAARLRGDVLQLENEIAEAQATIDAAGSVLPSPDELGVLQDEFGNYQETLASMRNEMNAHNVDLNRLNSALSNATRTLSQLDSLRADQADLPTLRDEARAIARDPNATAGDVTSAEVAVAAVERRIDDTYAILGLTGLEFVESRAIGGFMLAIIIGVAGIVLSFPIGIALALGRQSDLLIIKLFCVAFIETIRGVPLIVWLFTAQLLLNYFLPPGTTFDLLLRVVIMVTLFASAYIAEVIRGGLAALPRGQYEGADSLGLDYWQSMRLIILPQSLKISIPGIVNTFIGLFKDTTLVVFIGLFDTIGLINAIRADTDWNGIYWELFIFVGLLFFVCCFSMSKYSQHLERKLRTDHR